MKRIPVSSFPVLATAVVFFLLFTAASLSFPGFCSPYVITDLFSENAFLGIAALGMTLVILSGGIDLSVGSLIGFTTILTARCITEFQLHPLLAWLCALIIGAAFGALMGTLIVRFKMPPFLVTLGGLFLARGLAFAIKKESIQIHHSFYDSLDNFRIPIAQAELTFPAILFLLLLLRLIWLLHYTPFGRTIYAIGGNQHSARLMGLPVDRSLIWVYTLNGLFAALAGIAMTLYMDSGNPTNAMALELDVIAVVVIGGTLLSGGVGYAVGTLLGFLIHTTIYQITYFANLPASLGSITIGLLLLLFILLQRSLSRIQR